MTWLKLEYKTEKVQLTGVHGGFELSGVNLYELISVNIWERVWRFTIWKNLQTVVETRRTEKLRKIRCNIILQIIACFIIYTVKYAQSLV